VRVDGSFALAFLQDLGSGRLRSEERMLKSEFEQRGVPVELYTMKRIQRRNRESCSRHRDSSLSRHPSLPMCKPQLPGRRTASRVLWALIIGLTIGCTASRHSVPVEFSADPERDVELRRVWSRGDFSKYRLRNLSQRTVRYLHWASQGPEPVAYCLRADGSQWICSERVYVEGNQETGYVEWTHETILPPNSTVSFKVRAGAETKVAIKALPVSSSKEVLIWGKN
jgi:hypothetical protein